MQYQMQVDPARRGFRSAVLAIFLVAMGGCSIDVEDPLAQVLAGSVGDGPVVDARVTITDADGAVVTETVSDITANYAVDVPAGHRYPLILTAMGGSDLVTGRALDFTLRSVVLGPEITRVNVSPITTLALAIAVCSGVAELDATRLDAAFQTLAAELSMGLDLTLVMDPLHDEVTPATAANLVLANEALAEALRRTRTALATTGSASDLDTLVERLGCDLADGVVDGLGGESGGSDSRIAATFYAASAGVMLELIAGSLEVDGQLAVGLLDQALLQIFPDSPTPLSVQDVPVTDALVQQTRDALAALQTGMDDEQLTKYVVLLDESTSARARDAVSMEMTVEDDAVFAGLAERVALQDEATLGTQTNALRKKKDALPPVLSFASNTDSVVVGDPAMLTWASINADRCRAKGDWSGRKAVDGTFATDPLVATAQYILSCAGMGGTDTATVTVTVENVTPAQPPVISLRVDTSSVSIGESVVLSWSTSGADFCAALADWGGVKQLNGQETVGPLDTDSSFVLSCDGPGGTSSDVVSVTVAALPPPEPPPPTPPTAAIAASPTSVAYSGSTLLSWSSTDADGCTAGGDWSGSKGTSGSETISGLTATSNFIVTCFGAGGTASQGVTVDVAAAPADPTVSLSASESSVDRGADATLVWVGTDVDSCDASGGWSGAREVSGSEVVGPIDQDTTFSLTCTGPGGSALAMTTVQIRAVTLSWDAPVANVDGSPLTDLGGFRVYHGSASRSYNQSIEVADPLATELVLILSPGTYYFAMTAYDVDNNESAFSNEVSKTIQ